MIRLYHQHNLCGYDVQGGGHEYTLLVPRPPYRNRQRLGLRQAAQLAENGKRSAMRRSHSVSTFHLLETEPTDTTQVYHVRRTTSTAKATSL